MELQAQVRAASPALSGSCRGHGTGPRRSKKAAVAVGESGLSEDVEGLVCDVVWARAFVVLPSHRHPRKLVLAERLPRRFLASSPDAFAAGCKVGISARAVTFVEDGFEVGEQYPLPVVAVCERRHPLLAPLSSHVLSVRRPVMLAGSVSDALLPLLVLPV